MTRGPSGRMSPLSQYLNFGRPADFICRNRPTIPLHSAGMDGRMTRTSCAVTEIYMVSMARGPTRS